MSSLPEHDAVVGLVSDLYASAYEPATWAATMEKLCHAFHGSKACIARVGPGLRPSDAISSAQDLSFQVRFIEDFGKESVVLRHPIESAAVGTIYSHHTLVGTDILRRSRFWNEWMAPQDMYGGLGCKVQVIGPSFWIFDVQRGRNHNDFDSGDVELFSLLAPHVRRDLEIGRKLQTSEGVAATFSHLPFGLFIVAKDQRIIAMNAAADAILGCVGSGLSSRFNVLRTHAPRASALLTRLVADACRDPDGKGTAMGGDFQLSTEAIGGNQNLSISVGPFLDRAHQGLFLEPCAVVVVREITFDLPANFREHIRALFDLTPKEAELAVGLAAGCALAIAAQMAGVRIATARSHLARIFAKTRTNQQSQLVALLKGLSPVLRRR